MKRLLTSICIIFVLLTLSLTSIYILKKQVTQLNELLVKACDIAETKDNAELIKITDEIQNKWRHSHKILSTFLSHDELDELAVNIPSLNNFCKAEDYDEYKKICYSNIYWLEHLVDSSKPTLENIL